LIHFRVKNCNDLTQHAVYCPLWASQSTHFQGFHLGPPHGFVLGSHAWLQNAYNMLATGTIYKALALDARFDMGYHNPLTLRRAVLALIPNVTVWPNMLYIIRFEPLSPPIFTSVVFFSEGQVISKTFFVLGFNFRENSRLAIVTPKPSSH
jgi:hypothetical protein